MDTIQNFKEVISLWGKLADFAEDIDVTDLTARAMKQRDHVSSKYWDAMVRGAKRRGIKLVTYKTLALLAAEKIKHKRSN